MRKPASVKPFHHGGRMRPLFWCLLLLDAAAATIAQTVQSAPASPAQVGAASNISQSMCRGALNQPAPCLPRRLGQIAGNSDWIPPFRKPLVAKAPHSALTDNCRSSRNEDGCSRQVNWRFGTNYRCGTDGAHFPLDYQVVRV